MKANNKIRAIQIFRFYRAGCATGLPEACPGGQKIITDLEKLMAFCDTAEFCERCACVLVGDKCRNPECEHKRILADIDATE